MATLILISGLLNHRNQYFDKLTGTFYCDNEAVVCKYATMEGFRPYSVKQANENDTDILQELRYWKQKIPRGIRIEWIKSNKSNPTTRVGRLNRVADHLAAEQHNAPPPLITQSACPMLPKTHAKLILSWIRHTSNIDKKSNTDTTSQQPKPIFPTELTSQARATLFTGTQSINSINN